MNLGRVVPRGRLRRRLTLAFMLAAGLSAAALASGSYLLVRDSRLDDSRDRSLEQARTTFVLAATILAGRSDRAAAGELLTALERRPGFDAVALAGGDAVSSSLSLGRGQVPAELRSLVARGGLAYQRVEAGGTRYLVVGGRPFRSEAELYLFFSEERVYEDLRELAVVLFAGTGVLVALAGAGGALLARRTLRPVARASAAAHSLAEGLLETRLPVERADEFGAWAAAFNEMAEALEQKIEALSEAQARERRFTADVAHELRTPLTALVNEAALLHELLERLPPEARRPAELLAGDVARLRRLVEELMEISRLDAGRESLELAPVDLRALVESVVRARGWDGRVAVSGAPVVVESDARRLERVVGNLVENAVEHGGVAVAVSVAREPGGAAVAVSDGGPGIPPEHLPHVFERFYKADRARARGGSGLGLAIALENARLLGGDLTAASEPGAGARFVLRLPLPETVVEPLHAGEESVAREEEHESRNRGGEER